jgi:hypothetical protein
MLDAKVNAWAKLVQNSLSARSDRRELTQTASEFCVNAESRSSQTFDNSKVILFTNN